MQDRLALGALCATGQSTHHSHVSARSSAECRLSVAGSCQAAVAGWQRYNNGNASTRLMQLRSLLLRTLGWSA